MPTNNLQTLTVAGAITQGTAATQDNHLIRLVEAKALLATLFKGAWSGATTYGAGVLVSSANALWLSLQAANLNHAPAEGAWWTNALSGGVDGASVYAYIAFASDASGTDFSLTPASNLPYTAIKLSATVIATPQASDFAGLWRDMSGPAGAAGAAGADGAAGASAYLYLAYASDASGTGFSLSPGAGLYYMAAKATATAIVSPQATDFTGLWFSTRGQDGAAGNDGADGAAGASVYGYAGYASDASGTGFSLSPGAGLNFFAIKLSATPIVSPQASDFTGLWRRWAIPDDLSVPANTDDLAEGTVHLYFTMDRVLSAALAGLDATAGGDVEATDTLLAAISKLQNRVKTIEDTLSSPGQALFDEGSVAVNNGDQTGTVTGLALTFTPARIQLTVQVPAGGQFLTAVCVGAPTADGFGWALSAAAPATGYKIHYRIT